jgi:hypothetical protein
MVARHVTLLNLALLVAACDHGSQTLAWERGATATDAGNSVQDEYASWYGGPPYYAAWPRGFPSDTNAFPLGVWMQDPANASRFQDVGINLYFGLWQGPTEDQLTELAANGMHTACDSSGVWQSHLSDSTIRTWLQTEGPDNAQTLSDGSYGPCIEPRVVIANYASLRQTDSSRPVLLSFGPGAAVTDWEGRGSCTSRTDMYPEYAKGADILGFWVYPVNEGLSFEAVAEGTDNVLKWSNFTKPVFSIIEASSFDGVTRPTPAQIRAETWMALIHGAAGIEYYCHGWQPEQTDIDCLDDATTAAALKKQNQQLLDLAPLLNSPTVTNGLTVKTDKSGARIDTMLKRKGGTTYLFAIAMGGVATRGTFALARIPNEQTAEALGESRTIDVKNGTFSDDFEAYAVHLYRITD